MKILAFLQNPWFKPDTNMRLIEKYQTDPDFHRRVLLLSATGKALYRAFGPELYDKIIWDNANPRHGNTRESMMPYDPAHMAKVLILNRPDLILCFGREAKMGMGRLMNGRWPNVLFAPHPMARGSAANHLKDIVQKVKEIYGN